MSTRPDTRATAIETLVAALGDPRRYPHAVERVEVIETHISYVLLAGERAYKLKKPLDLGFLDYGTVDKRRLACEEELRLNRRTAPELYLSVVPIGGTPADPRLFGEPACEYAVEMRRFAQEDLCDRRVARGALGAAELEVFAADLAEFHARAAAAGPELAFGLPEHVLAPAHANFASLSKHAASAGERAQIERLHAWTDAAGARCRADFAARKRTGRVRECHGDLHLGNVVFLAGRAVPFDCIEFDPGLRWIDVTSEVAFFAMDLLDHRQPALAHIFLDAYLSATGDYGALAVLPFYLVYRALVRAKIACIRARQPGLDLHGRTRANVQSHGYLELAEALTLPRPRALILMHGLSGSGKSTVAASVVARGGALRLRSDVERKRIAGLAPGQRSGAGLGADLYAPQSSIATYARLAELADVVLRAGFPVVVDATSLRRSERAAFRAVAERAGVPFALLSCRAAPSTLRARIAERDARGVDPSEATLEVLEHQLRTQEPLDTDEIALATELDTDNGSEPTAAALEGLLTRLWLEATPPSGGCQGSCRPG